MEATESEIEDSSFYSFLPGQSLFEFLVKAKFLA